jgi:hypothetical protein
MYWRAFGTIAEGGAVKRGRARRESGRNASRHLAEIMCTVHTITMNVGRLTAYRNQTAVYSCK